LTNKSMGSKGERLLLDAPGPKVSAELPMALRTQEVIHFNVEKYDLHSAATSMLDCGKQIGSFTDDARTLELYKANEAVFRSFATRQRLRNVVNDNSAFLDVYEKLVVEVLLPWLKNHVIERTGHSEPTTFSYQYPPTLRIQPGPSQQFRRTHRDAEYGHQVGELNFWMPLTNYSQMTQTTLWVESQPDADDYQPLAIDYGSIAMFHGTLCRHKVPANSSSFTRISMDFRIGIGEFYDRDWHLDGVKMEHGRREAIL